MPSASNTCVIDFFVPRMNFFIFRFSASADWRSVGSLLTIMWPNGPKLKRSSASSSEKDTTAKTKIMQIVPSYRDFGRLLQKPAIFLGSLRSPIN